MCYSSSKTDMNVSFVCTFICTSGFCCFLKEGTVVGQERNGGWRLDEVEVGWR